MKNILLAVAIFGILSCIGNSSQFAIPDSNVNFTHSIFDNEDKATSNLTICIYSNRFKGDFLYTLEASNDPGSLLSIKMENIISDTCIRYDWYSRECKFNYIPLGKCSGSLKFKLSIY